MNRILIIKLIVWFGFAALGAAILLGSNHSFLSEPERVSTKTQIQSESPSWAFQHDFGVVFPASKHSHCFHIRNETSIKWTVERIANSCSCTAASVSAKQVDPGGALDVDINYTAGSRDLVDSKEVVVFFDNGVPPAVLKLRASIQSPIKTNHSEINFHKVGIGTEVTEILEVQNLSNENWDNFKVSADQSWLNLICRPKSASSKDSTVLRQSWDVIITVKTGKGPGRLDGEICIDSGIAAVGVKTIPVSLVLTSAIQVVPEQIFISDLKVGKPTTTRVTILFTLDSQMNSLQDITLSHTLGESPLVFAWEKINDYNRVLSVTITPQQNLATELINGKIILDFSGPNGRRIEIPVCCKVVKP